MLDLDNDKYLSPKQAAELSVHAQTYWQDRAIGRERPPVPAIRMGRRIRILKSDVMAYIAANSKPIVPKEKKSSPTTNN
jgi:hypothetical protein